MYKIRSLLATAPALLFVSSVCPVLTNPAAAGPNASGTLILHRHEVVIYCQEYPSYCELVQVEDPLLDCLEARTNLVSPETQLWSVYAAFPSSASPRVAGLTFGVDYDDENAFVLAVESCADFELPTGSWPNPGEGTAITWTPAQTDPLVHAYFFAGYEYYGTSTSFDLIPHPTQGAYFADDDVPSNLDPIADLGRLGFNDNPGYLPCPVDDPLGACCIYPECSCELLTREACEQTGVGEWYGPGTVCDPNPCACPPFGACCFSDGTCTFEPEAECRDAGGEYLGDDVPCDPNPCDPVPTQRTSWGELKATYR